MAGSRVWRRWQDRETADRFRSLLFHGLLLSGLVLGTAGCPVDARELAETDGKGGGRATGGTTSGGASNTGGSGGTQNRGGRASRGDAGEMSTSSGGDTGEGGDMGGGAAGMTGADAGSSGSGGAGWVDGCTDLDNNHVGDCTETLAKNADFVESSDGWKAEPDSIAVTWKQKQGEQRGLLSVKNSRYADFEGLSMGGGMQCLRAQSNYTYWISARVFIPDGQGTGQGGAGLFFYDSVDCSGNPNYGFTGTLFTGIGTWHISEGYGQAPVTTRSMAIRLLSTKPFRQNWFEALFDDVLVRRY